jgi:hypothetical protein
LSVFVKLVFVNGYAGVKNGIEFITVRAAEVKLD